jgi:hypothetical protein
MKAAVLRLASGAVLLCSIDTTKKLLGGGTFVALSLDDGKTWAHVRRVEGVGGYMALAQAPNGVIYLTGTRLGVVAFNEAWLRQGKALPGGSAKRFIRPTQARPGEPPGLRRFSRTGQALAGQSLPRSARRRFVSPASSGPSQGQGLGPAGGGGRT